MGKVSIALLLIFVLSFLLKADYSFDQDLGRHIKFGEIIWQTKSIPHTNLFSYTYPDFPFINSHWLFEVLSYFLSQNFGMQTLYWLKIVMLLTTIYLLLTTCRKSWLLLPIGFLFIHLLRERTNFRPELFSFLFTVLTFYILEKYRQHKLRLFYLLPVIQLIWVNIHIYFLVGLVIQGVFLADSFLRSKFLNLKPLIIVLIISMAATLINPNFITGALYPLNVLGNYGYSIAENQNIFLLENIGFKDPNFLFVKLAILIILITWVYGLFNNSIGFIPFCLSAIGVTLALLNIRSFPYLIFLSLPTTLQILKPLQNQKWLRALNYFVVVILIFESYFYINGSYYLYTDSQKKMGLGLQENYGKGLDFLLINDLPQPILNNFDIGSYIEYRSYPKYKTFVDGRPEAYPVDFFQKIYIPIQEKTEVFEQAMQKYEFKTIIFSITDQTPWARTFLSSLIKNPQWQIVYLDDFLMILVTKESVESMGLQPIDLSQTTPQLIASNDNMAYLKVAFFLYNTGHLKQAYDFTQKSLSIFPYSPSANRLMTAILQGSGDSFGVFNSGQYYQNSSNLYYW